MRGRTLLACITLPLFITARSGNAALGKGRFEVETNRTAPTKSLVLRLRPIANDSAKDIAVDCFVDEHAWSCRTPEGAFDAELHADGYAPVYIWGLGLEVGGERDLGSVHLTRGSTVIGKIVDRGAALKGVTVELVPAGSLTGKDALRNQFRTRRTISDQRGLFSFSGWESWIVVS